MFNRYFWPMFLLVALIAGLHLYGTAHYYYWTTNWFDFLMHFLGGLWIALFYLWFDSWIPLPVRATKAVRVISFVLFVGIVWEFHELYFQLTFINDAGYVWDTTHDIIMDTLGGIVGWYVVHKALTKTNE